MSLSLGDSGALLEVIALLIIQFAAIYAFHVVGSEYFFMAAVEESEGGCLLRKIWSFHLYMFLYLSFYLLDLTGFVAEKGEHYFRLV